MIHIVKCPRLACRRLTTTPAGAIAPHQIPIIRFEDLLQLLTAAVGPNATSSDVRSSAALGG
jgi:hypothetical protein